MDNKLTRSDTDFFFPGRTNSDNNLYASTGGEFMANSMHTGSERVDN